MYLIDRKKNEAVAIPERTFQNLKFKERKHLQEWICKNPNILGEPLLIIQKEFAGFDGTNERLDLLALDENGNIVLIENKLDDSGKDVVWQALKYASYCSSLSKTDIRDIFQKYLDSHEKNASAEERISDLLKMKDFDEVELNSNDQRIILVAAHFRKEVTSTVMWLLDHNVKIKCIKITPYELGDQIFLDTEQIIPVKGAENYLVKITKKRQEELINRERTQTSQMTRVKFWTQLLQEMSKKIDLFQNISPSKDSWINCGSGYSGVPYTLVATKSYARVELWINKGSQEENKKIFDEIYVYKDDIEATFGHELDWQRLNEGKGSRIAYHLRDVSVFNEEDWEKMIEFLIKNMVEFEKSIKKILHKVMKK